MILVYAFANQWGTNISRRVLRELELILGKNNINFQIVYFSPQRFFEKNIKGSSYDLIVGLGDFGRDIFKIRMETVAHNRFGDKPRLIPCHHTAWNYRCQRWILLIPINLA